MRKRWLISGIVILTIFPLLLSGCGVSQEVHDAVVAERDAAKTEVQLLQSDLAEAQAQIQSLQGEVQAAKEHILLARTNAEIVNSIFIPAVTGELDEISETEIMSLILEWNDKIETTEDPQMMTMFEALLDSKFGDEEMLDFFVYVLERIPEILE